MHNLKLIKLIYTKQRCILLLFSKTLKLVSYQDIQLVFYLPIGLSFSKEYQPMKLNLFD